MTEVAGESTMQSGPKRIPRTTARTETTEVRSRRSQEAVGDEVDDDPKTRWLLLVYRVPPEPTRLRATVWRRLKSLGAIYVQNSAAALPSSPSGDRALRKLRHDINEMDGTAVLFRCQVLAGESEVRAAFQAARNDEYEEIVDRCKDFLTQVEKEHVAAHFTYAELEENEVDLAKLQNWFTKVRDRDVFGASGSQVVVHALAECEKALEDYASRVYDEEQEAH